MRSEHTLQLEALKRIARPRSARSRPARRPARGAPLSGNQLDWDGAAESAQASQRLEREYWRRLTVGGALKRVFDIAIAATALIVLSPVMLFLAASVRLSDGGPALFRHKRVGRGGEFFECLKFRSMRQNGEELLRAHLAANPAAAAEWEAIHKLRHDPRITWIGHLLRTTSLDELPQLINVLRGEMSIVGPRPVVADELPRYKLARVHYLSARPGLTGLWQVSGRNNTTYEQRVLFDKSYVLRWSLLQDVSIIARTVPAVLFARGVC